MNNFDWFCVRCLSLLVNIVFHMGNLLLQQCRGYENLNLSLARVPKQLLAKSARVHQGSSVGFSARPIWLWRYSHRVFKTRSD